MRNKKQFPMMPWFPQNFSASTRGWSLSERAVYRELLDAQWEMGPLPNDPEVLARIVHLTCTEFVPLFSKCASKFAVKNGCIENKRLEQHRRKSRKISKLRARIGSTGGRAKAVAIASNVALAKNNHLSISYSESDLRAATPHSPVPEDPRSALWEIGVKILGPSARSIIGQAIKRVGEGKVSEVIGHMAGRAPAEPRSYFIKATQERGVVV